MKRQLEQTDEGDAFFRHPDSVEILLLSVPSPTLVALLLQLCKEMRRLVWDFLTVRQKCSDSFVIDFCRELWSHRERRVRQYDTMQLMHPVFYPGMMNGVEAYLFAKIDVDSILSPCQISQVETGMCLPQWMVGIEAKNEDFFQWYFVAHALVLRFDSKIYHNQKRCRLGDPSTAPDLDLCLL
jgi:hypothetical protein